MEVANEIAKGVVQVLMVPVKKQLDYVISHKKYLEDMHKKMKDLDAKKVSVESQKKQNRERRLEVPAQVNPWLIEVEQMNAKVEHFPSEVPGCLDLKSRHKLGSKASKIIKEINSVLGRCPEIRGTELQIPLGRIDSTIGSTSTPSSDRNDFRSREHTFTKALEALGPGPNHSSHMVALWGMGGVGKTTMMKKLKEVVVEKKMFNHYVEVVIGEKTDPIAIQHAVAEYLGIDLTQTTKSARTNKLQTWFVNNSDGGKKKFLVILDDVWQPVDMEDIGLSCLPNQGIDFKVLMTSRNKDVCTEMGVKVDSILNVGCLTDLEAQSLFLQLWEPSDDVDADLYNIGEQIVRKCCGLPIAIKTMACTLRGKSKDAWKDALNRFQHPDNINKVAPTVFKTSYDNLQDEVIEETFLLCGLFPEDFNIPTEDLLWYGWGLKLFRGLDTIREARYRLNTCIERLMHTNLLIESNVLGCVKMHDLVRDFVLDMFSKDAHAAIVNHGSKPSWPENDMSSSCKRISLTCRDMAEFPSDLKFPNLTILKLMHGDESLRFPQGFYGQMEKLLVISYDGMEFLPSSLECCTNLRVLRLDECSVRFDLSCIGNLSNLEVLNFANCGVKRLPSIIGNLKKLRVLDVTGCGGLRIDNDLFKNLVRLEELYACPFDYRGSTISFTGDNCNEVAECWRNISALEYEFFKEKSQLMNLSFENLERFRISVECSLRGRSKHSFENTLKLVMKKGELVGSRINELFEKTIVLSLSVVDMNYLEDVAVKSLLRPQPSSFRNIRVLVVSECAELRYIFTHNVANSMLNLEDLYVFDCLVMKELIHIESGEEGRITFPNLKSLNLRRLPKLSGLCQNVNVIALPQLVMLEIEGLPNIKSIYSKTKLAVDCFLREEVLIPTLELLSVMGMDNLKEIWPCEFRMSEEVKLREIRVERCDKLVNLFPCNPLPLLHHLEELHVRKCGSIEVLFNLDLDCVGVNEKGSISRLRNIYVGDSGKLREVWKIKGSENNFGLPIRGFQAVEIIKILHCVRFRYLFTPTTTNFDIGALIDLHISTPTQTNNGSVESSPQEIKLLSKEGTSEVSASISYNLFPSSVLHCFQNLRELLLTSHHEVDVIFEIESTPKSQDNQKRLFPHLEKLEINDMERLSHIWNCNWNTFLNTQKQHPESSFHNLTTIAMHKCKSIKYLFSPLMAILLSNLKTVDIGDCDGIEQVVSHIDDEEEKTASTSTHTSTALFPHLDSLTLQTLENLKCIDGRGVAKDGKNEMALNKTTTNATFLDPVKISQVDGVWWTLCQYPREIRIGYCQSLSHIIPCYAVGQMIKLQELNIYSCNGMREVFETERINKSVSMLKLTNLKILEIRSCGLLENIFTFSTLETLGQLEELIIGSCNSMKVIVKEEEDASSSSSKVVVFPRLKFIKLVELPELVGFFIGTNEFQWPALDVLEIDGCPKMNAFTIGGFKAPQLKYEETHELDKHTPERAFNSHVTTTPSGLHSEISQVDGVWWTLCQYPRKIRIRKCHSLSHMVPCYAVGQMIKLQELEIYNCDGMREVFETERINKSVSMLKLTNLKMLGIGSCDLLENIFTFSTLETLGQLEELRISWCKSMKVIVKEEEDASSSSSKAVVFPRLKFITLYELPELVGFFIGTNEFQWPALDVLWISYCPKMKAFMTGGLKAPQLKYEETHGLDKHSPEVRAFNSHVTTTPSRLHPEFPLLADDVSCIGMKEVFETQGIHKSLIMFQLANLKKLIIDSCDGLEHIFTFSTFGTLGQLDNLMIGSCKAMKVIMKEEEDASSSTVVVFPRLKCIKLDDVPELEGFFLGKNEFIWPSLDEVVVNGCPQMKVFTAGGSTAPQLKYVATGLSKYSPECWFKSHVTNTTAVLHQETPFPSLESSSSEEIDIWSFHNLIEIKVIYDDSVEKIIPSRELLKLQKLETIRVELCSRAEEVFEAFEAGNDSQTTLVKLPNLTEVMLDGLPSLRYIWKSNQWTVFLFPNLTRLFISRCNKLEHVFSSSMVGSLLQLQELRIIECRDMEEVFFGDGNIVVNEEEQEKEYDGKINEIVFPFLKSLTLAGLSHLKGFCLGKEDFSFPLLDTLTIQECPAMTTFTIGYSSTPELQEIKTKFVHYDVEKDINSLIKTKQEIMTMNDDDAW